MNIVRTEFFPTELEADTLYVSDEYCTTAHLCASGCGFKVVLPLGKGSWQLIDDEHATLWPSIHVPSCNSHYWIEHGDIRWARAMSEDYAKQYAERDQQAFNKEIAPKSVFERIWAWLSSLFRK